MLGVSHNQLSHSDKDLKISLRLNQKRDLTTMRVALGGLVADQLLAL